jgi:hypothetical protein
MFESIHTKVPDLAQLQQVVTNLEQETHEAEGRVAQLHLEAQSAHEDDLNREATALNAGRRAPRPTEPDVRAKLEGAQRRLEVLQRRLALAQSDVARYISSHSDELVELVQKAKASKAREVSELAAPLAKALGEFQQPDLDLRALQPYLELPAQENTGEPESSITVLGPLTTRSAFGEKIADQTIGQVQNIVTELVGLAARYEQGDTTIVGPSEAEDEGAA